jgi:hypothetical protein
MRPITQPTRRHVPDRGERKDHSILMTDTTRITDEVPSDPVADAVWAVYALLPASGSFSWPELAA